MLKKLDLKETCYMCHRPKTSKEHVPPKCIFPSDKDLEDGFGLRKNLIKVPSCDIHNSQKSKDDEYLMFILASGILGNRYKDGQVKTKIMRALKRRPHVYTSFMNDLTPVLLKGEDGKVHESASFKVDLKRFDNIACHMACGIFFHHYEKKWLGGFKVFSNMLLDLESTDSVKVNNAVRNAATYASKLFSECEEFGENKEIFKYKIISEGDLKHGIHMVFYEGVEITVLLQNV